MERVMGTIVPFPSPTQRPSQLSIYDYWFDVLAEMPACTRRRAILGAYRCGYIDDHDAEIFLSSWPEDCGSLPNWLRA